MAVPGTGISAQVAIPYVEIINCCDSSDRGLFNIDGFDPATFQDGVYNYTGPGFATPQITFVTGNCYTIVNPGNSGTPYFPIPPVQWVNFSLTSTDVENGCLDCIDCNPSLSKLVFTSCCNQSVVQTQGQLPFGTTQWIIKYTGPLVNGFDNKCYVVTQVDNISPEEYATLPLAPVNGTYVLVSNDPKAECSDYPVPECPACQDPQCYTLVNCDGVYFDTWEDLSAYVGQFIQIQDQPGSWYVSLNSGSCKNAVISIDVIGLADPCPCLCYEVTGTLKSLRYVNCDNEIVKDATATKFCSRIFPIFSGTAGQYQILQGDECVNGLCPEKCYKLTNCDTKEVIYSTLQTLSQYVNTSTVVTLLGYDGCWTVEENIATGCECITVTIETRAGVTEYTATLIAPYNGWNRWTFVIGSDNYYIWNASVNPSTNWTISKDSSGPIPGQTYAQSKFNGECPEMISDGTLTGWVIQGGVPWINVQTEICPAPCDCAKDITVIQEFDSCEACKPYIAYKLQNCEKIYEVQYTTQDLSEYVNQVIETDCGCFTVQQINYVPPSETLIVIENGFKTCNDCLSTFYRLVDCSGESGDIVTRTNLADYVGQVIKIENCDTCWEVSTTRTFTELSNVVVVNSYKDCPACGVDLPCVCSKLTNLTSTEQLIEYIDCENETQEIILQPGETSQKICLKKWILDTPQPLPPNELLYPEYFGNCQNGVCPQPVFKNNRTVKPGYNTPACTPEKYDEITCRFADIMYKVVLEKRYGITNCCPEEDDKWLIKKELIDLQALKDPNYNCPDCPCSCNSGKSCSTCNCKN